MKRYLLFKDILIYFFIPFIYYIFVKMCPFHDSSQSINVHKQSNINTSVL